MNMIFKNLLLIILSIIMLPIRIMAFMILFSIISLGVALTPNMDIGLIIIIVELGIPIIFVSFIVSKIIKIIK